MDITYAFGVGDGELTEWTSPADVDIDGDGVPDAVALDFDGDGLVDDVMWDSDGDGVADAAGLDVEVLGGGDERWFADADHLGTWATPTDRASLAATPAPRSPTAPAPPSAPAAHSAPGALSSGGAGGPAVLIDTDGDGTADTRLVDTDGDGHLDSSRPLGSAERATAAADPPLIAGASVRRWQGDTSS